MHIIFNNTYSKLPSNFYQNCKAIPVKNPKLIQINSDLVKELGINFDENKQSDFAQVFSGNKILDGSEPIAQVYAGHQFGYFSPQLGDGRAVLLGEILDINDNRKDLVLKGSGETSYSRGGDGRATLGSVVREYIMSEAMFYLGIPTTRSLSIVSSGEVVFRNNIQPGGVLCRVASSHIRIGTFEYFFKKQDYNSVKVLADYSISRHYPEIEKAENKYELFFQKVIEKQIDLVVNWMRVGFIHGVMNTDNMLISGETIDYGPCAFMDDYNKNTVFSSIDENGRYNFMNQKHALEWNLARFGETLIPLLGDKIDNSIKIIENNVGNIRIKFDVEYSIMMHNKIGIFEDRYFDKNIVIQILELLEKYNLDYTDFFRNLSCTLLNNDNEIIGKYFKNSEINSWIDKWKKIIENQEIESKYVIIKMNKINPKMIPRNYRVEEIISQSEINNDFSNMKKIIEILKNPYVDNGEYSKNMKAPGFKDSNYRTYCGT